MKVLKVHFVHNEPMPLFREALTNIVVSHWGNIAIDEYFLLGNEAAKIKGQFSRADYYQTGEFAYSGGDTSIKSLHTSFPRHIHDLYYHDFIGNISSSHAFRDENEVSFDIEPRFHVFGGWKTDWHQGYAVRNKHNLFYNKLQQDVFTFNYTFLHSMGSFMTEDYELRVMLPEGATDIEVKIPFEAEIEQKTEFSYLDFIGRPVMVIKKANVIDDYHNKDF